MVVLKGWRLEIWLARWQAGAWPAFTPKNILARSSGRSVGFGNPRFSRSSCFATLQLLLQSMNPDDLNAVEAKRQALLGQLKAAESALRSGLHTHGFGSTARAHMERALAHIQEAYVAINEINRARTVQQLVDDLNRIQQVMDDAKRGKSQRI